MWLLFTIGFMVLALKVSRFNFMLALISTSLR